MPKVQNIAVFDTETDGVDVFNCHIVTAFVGLMDAATGELIEKWSWLLNTGHEIPKEASDVHGISTERMQAEGTDAKAGIYEIAQRLDIIDRQGIPIVVYNAPFDFTLLAAELHRHYPGARPVDPNYIIEPFLIAGAIEPQFVIDPFVIDKALDPFRKGKRKLVDVAAHYGVTVLENAHDAEADCIMAGQLALKLLASTKPLPRGGTLAGLTLAQIHSKQVFAKEAQTKSFRKYLYTKADKIVDETERAAARAAVEDVSYGWPLRSLPWREENQENTPA